MTTPFQPLDPTSKEKVQFVLSKFKNKKGPGQDAIKEETLKLGGEVFIEAFVSLANFALSTGYFPKRWKPACEYSCTRPARITARHHQCERLIL